jgi:hypothetical protein
MKFIPALQIGFAWVRSLIGFVVTLAGTTGGFSRCVAEAAVLLAGASGSIAIGVPKGARILGIQLRVDTLIASADGGTTWKADYVNTPTTAICTAQAFAKNTKVDAIHPAYEITTDVVSITITPDAGTFSAGIVRAIVYYENITAMANA